jgi:hypothetical protein
VIGGRKMDNPEEVKRVVEIEGKHGLIRLIIPNRKPTQEEWIGLHTVIAESIVSGEKEKMKKDKEEAAK